jgi:hypothetical protein
MKLLCLAALALAAFATPAFAQSQSEFVAAFSGKWQVYDQRLAGRDSVCVLDLSGLALNGASSVTATGCVAPLAGVASWAIENGQLVLQDSARAALAVLGGSPKRVTGATTDGRSVILERPGGDGMAASLQAAFNASGCYFVGYSQTCAKLEELVRPEASGAKPGAVKLLVNLSVYSEPRGDAEIVGAVQNTQCVAVETCIVASDGPWCRAKFGAVTGWLRKYTLRQNRWPVLTYANSCGQ